MPRTAEITLYDIPLEVEYELSGEELPGLLHVWYGGELSALYAVDLIDLLKTDLPAPVIARIAEKCLADAKSRSYEAGLEARDDDRELRELAR